MECTRKKLMKKHFALSMHSALPTSPVFLGPFAPGKAGKSWLSLRLSFSESGVEQLLSNSEISPFSMGVCGVSGRLLPSVKSPLVSSTNAASAASPMPGVMSLTGLSIVVLFDAASAGWVCLMTLWMAGWFRSSLFLFECCKARYNWQENNYSKETTVIIFTI